MKSIFLLPFCLYCLGVAFAQSQPVKRLYLANDDHTDYMWTANEAQYDSAFVKMLDYYLGQIDSTQTHPDDFQARYNCDGSYWLRAYQKYRSPTQFNRLIGAIRSGHLSSPVNTLVSTYGAQPTEAVIRGMFYAGQLERAYQIRFTMAGAMESGNPEAKAIVKQVIDHLKTGLDTYINLFAPDIIILGGGVAKGLKKHLPALHSPQLLRPHTKYSVVIETSALEEQSGILGSALLVKDEI